MFPRPLLLLFAAATLFAQDTAPPSVRVTGDVPTPLTLTAADLRAMPRTSFQSVRNGLPTRYDGVSLHLILKAAGVPAGSDLRGKALSSYVLAVASDGYQALFSLAELDPALLGSRTFLADSADGKPLAAAQGPLRLIVPDDKSGSRSVRMLTKLEVVQGRR